MSLTWPEHILSIASSAKISDHYFGLYNTLIFLWFDPYGSDDVILTPEKHEYHSIYFVVYTKKYRPLLMMNVENNVSSQGRIKADAQMRQKYDTLLTKCPLPRLWGFSFVGTWLRVYCGDVTTGNVTPPSEDNLEQAWNIDLLSSEGFAKVNEIIKVVRDDAGL